MYNFTMYPLGCVPVYWVCKAIHVNYYQIQDGGDLQKVGGKEAWLGGARVELVTL